ncbi:MAG: peptidylprolyl isomerase [Bdellovibrionaceae bacterium]|nr:peptidylprolyl isomerase [Pseudobdellovibrionaceae bacterium]
MSSLALGSRVLTIGLFVGCFFGVSHVHAQSDGAIFVAQQNLAPVDPYAAPPAGDGLPPSSGTATFSAPNEAPPQDPTSLPSNDTSTGVVGPDGSPMQVILPNQPAPGGTSTLPAPVESSQSYDVPPPTDSSTQQITPSEVVEIKKESKEVSKKKTLAIFRTSMGNFTVRLFTRQAPRTTQHFIDLVRGDKEFIDAKTGRKTRRPFYSGLIFHRVIKNFIIQGGCPFGNGKGGPGFTIADEFSPNLRHRKAGVLSMASAGEKDTNGSQFFITLSPQPEFDDKYTIIGEVTQGMEIVNDIARVKVGPTDRPIKRVYIIAIDIVDE